MLKDLTYYIVIFRIIQINFCFSSIFDVVFKIKDGFYLIC